VIYLEVVIPFRYLADFRRVVRWRSRLVMFRKYEAYLFIQTVCRRESS
jgi:hypothetical protein